MPPAFPPRRGEIWQYLPDLPRGREQLGERPGIILSIDSFNRSGWELVVIVPVTTANRGYQAHVQVVSNPETGLKRASFALCDQLQSVSHERLLWRRGLVNSTTIGEMERAVRIVLGL